MQIWFLCVAIIAFVICVFAFVRGGWPERLVAMALTGEFAFHQAMQIAGRSPPFVSVTGEQFLPNFALLVLLTVIAVVANRVWTLGLAALQLIRVTSQIVVFVEQDGAKLAYWAMSQIPLAGELLLLLAGALAVEWRRRRGGRTRDWR